MKKDHVLEQGFTLIEIIIVLVLLGILAATAVPKYYDLVETANQKAATSAIAELQARVNLTFADQLLAGATCIEALKTAKGVVTATDTLTIGKYTLAVTGFAADTDKETTAKVSTVKINNETITAPKVDTTNVWPELNAPACKTAATTNPAG